MNHTTTSARRAGPRFGVAVLLLALIVTSALRATPAFALAPTPSVTSLSPDSGSTAGGYSVVITGTDFTGVTGVTVGGISVTATVNNDTTITILSMPPHAAGTVDVIVTDPVDGPSTETGNFTYLQAPVISGLSRPLGRPPVVTPSTSRGWGSPARHR